MWLLRHSVHAFRVFVFPHIITAILYEEKKTQVFRVVLYFKDKSRHVKNSCRCHWGRSLMWKHYAALKKLLLFTNCRLKQTQHNVIQNKEFNGVKCEENVSDKTSVIIESTQREKNVCKILKRSERGKKNSSTRNWPVWGFVTHRSHFQRVLNKQHNPPKKKILERQSWMKTR